MRHEDRRPGRRLRPTAVLRVKGPGSVPAAAVPRGPKLSVDPWRPLETLWEQERTPERTIEEVLTVFLAGAECPFSCVFCDLWRRTLEGPTPRGAIPRQLEQALASAGRRPDRIKLYNASNFFDARAVPPEDDAAIAALLAEIPAVTVECHPRLIGRRCFAFADRLATRLEVAMGLETVHTGALARLNKQMTLADFDRAAAALAQHDIDLRAFVLVGVPFVPPGDQAEWAVRSVQHAAAQGARRVALIPVRPGNGDLENLAATGDFAPPRLADLEVVLGRCLAEAPGPVLAADLWDIGHTAACEQCRPTRMARLARMNLSGFPEPRFLCATCEGEARSPRRARGQGRGDGTA